MATSLNRLALLYQALGDYGKAEPLYQRYLWIREKVLGRNHPDVAQSLNNQAWLYLETGRLDDACRHFKEKNILSGLGACHLARKEYAEAAGQYETALKSNEKSEEKECIIEDRIGLGLSYEGMKDSRKAIEEYRKAINLIECKIHITRRDYENSLKKNLFRSKCMLGTFSNT